MASGTPMLIIRPCPARSAATPKCSCATGAAIHLDRDRDLPAVVASLLANAALLDMLAARARALGKPDAARDIAEAVLAHLPPEEAPAE
jgi:processive 1,2-diacylglycerol beta-glucosyltransferase